MALSQIWTAGLLGLLSGVLHAGPDSPPETALADYVAKPDAAYAWRVHARYAAPGAEIVELRLHSQSWRGMLWKHQLYLIKPDSAGSDVRQGLLVIGGGRWRPEYETEVAEALPEDSDLFIAIAQQLGTVVAVLGQVPFQPLFDRREDELIAYTFEQYLATGDAEWPLLLPMVKSAVRAMDATQTVAAQEWGYGLDRFTVLGGSKRGWTTWLTGVVDQRAATLVPIVIDALNFEEHMPHQREIWGAPSIELEPYTKRNLHEILSSEEGRDLRRIVDPYSYREQLTQPKLIVVATNDTYFPLDSLNLYWDELPGPKHVLYLPNDGHSVEDFGRLIPAVNALHRNGATGEPLPVLAWEFKDTPGGLRLCVRSDPPPAGVVAWTAESEDTDFRDERFTPQPIPGQGDAFVLDVPPVSGFNAVLAEAVFGDGEDAYTLSTNVRVTDSSGRAPPAAAVAANGDACPAASN